MLRQVTLLAIIPSIPHRHSVLLGGGGMYLLHDILKHLLFFAIMIYLQRVGEFQGKHSRDPCYSYATHKQWLP